MVSDTFPGQEVTVGNHISLTLECESEEEIQDIYSKLSQKGAIDKGFKTFSGAQNMLR